jgi:sigma-B regulation protein RsbU (phosphoserine phosphatase)
MATIFTAAAILVADVSGKGIGASILTASMEALLAGPLEAGLAPSEICREVSERLYERTLAAKYATAVLVVLDPATGHLSYTNAGHNPGLIVREQGGVEELRTCGLPIGLLPGAEYETEETDLELGDLLVLYSDGITEATDREDEEFGLGRLRAICADRRHAPLPEIADDIAKALDDFVSGVPYADDRTLVLVRRRTEA